MQTDIYKGIYKGRNRFKSKLEIPFRELSFSLGSEVSRIIVSWDAEIKQRKPGIVRKFGMVAPPEHDTDFLFIYEYNHSITGKILWIENPKKYTSRSLNGYYWAIVNNRVEDYFDDLFQFPVLCSIQSFIVFCRRNGLSPYIDDDNYWAQNKYAMLLLEKVKDGALIYAPPED